MPQISDQTIEEVRARTDIVQIVSDRLPLKRAGGDWVACCPFHREKTPSFHVNPQRQNYHCFGCGAHGDVFKFLMEHDGVTFTDAVTRLAEKCGVSIELGDDGGRAARARRLFAVNSEAAAFFHRCLLQSSSAARAREYLQKRGLGPETVEKFQIGYDPDLRGALDEFARVRGFSRDEVAAAGIGILPSRPGETLLFDRFHGRLMFPIRDQQGRVVAFSGRVLDKAQSPAKYVNSPETEIFRKSRILYGLDLAQRPIANSERREAIVCEGQIDVIRCHSSGFPRAVASQGTAFTGEHASLLHRYADSAILLFDADSAGQHAALKTAGLLLAEGLPVRVAHLPAGEDPDSFLLSHPKEDFQKVLDSALGVVPFAVESFRASERDPDAADAVGRIAKGVLQVVAHCSNAVHKARMVQETARLLSLPENAVYAELSGVEEAVRRQEQGGWSQREASPAAARPAVSISGAPSLQPQDIPPEDLFADEPDPAPPSQSEVAPKEPGPDATDVAVCEFLLKHGEENPETIAVLSRLVPPSLFPNSRVRSIVDAIYSGGEALVSIQTADPRTADFIGSLLERRDPMAGHPMRDVVQRMVLDVWQRHLKNRMAEKSGDPIETLRARTEARRAILDMAEWKTGRARVYALAGIDEPPAGTDDFPGLPELEGEEREERPSKPYIRHKPVAEPDPPQIAEETEESPSADMDETFGETSAPDVADEMPEDDTLPDGL